MRNPPIAIFVLGAVATAWAQQVAAPTPEPVGAARGDNTGGYNITQSFETGYRWSLIDGSLEKYRSDVNFRNGVRLLGTQLGVHSLDGHGRFFDELLLNTTGLGNDPYESAVLRVGRNRLYRYDMTWRYNEYYNAGLPVAGGLHLADTGRRLQDHDIVLLPQSRVQFRAGYSRNTETGPALSTAQEFAANGFAFPVFTNVRREWNEYRLGVDVEASGFRFSVLRRWDFFKDDTPFSSGGAVTEGPAGAVTVLDRFSSSQPVHGSSPGWVGNLTGRRRLWAANARIVYVSGSRNFALNEFAFGATQLGPASRQVLVSGNARRPALSGDLALSLFPSSRLTVTNNTAIRSHRIDGDSAYSEVASGLNLGTTVSFRYLGIRTVANETALDYRAADWLGLFAAYRYSDRLVRTVEGSALAALPGSASSDTYSVTNILHSVTAGVRLRPWQPFTLRIEGEAGRANHPLTPQSERDYHTLNGRADYRKKNVQLYAAYRQFYRLNSPAALSLSTSHSRDATAGASWTPNGWFFLDASYIRMHLDAVTPLAFFAGVNRPQLQTGYSSFYESNTHSGNLGTRVEIHRRVDVYLGYSVVRDTGDGRATVAPAGATDPAAALLASVQTFPLSYHSPLARVSLRITPKLRWNAGWQFYRYSEQFHLLGFDQNYRAHTGYTSLLWSF